MAPAAENDDPFDREDAQDDPYNLGMMHGWDASSSEDGTAGAAKAKDAVHELEWDGQRWIAIHHATTRQDTFKVSKLKKAWSIPEAAPVYVDGCTSTGEFNMSYT
eukprot:690902-Amphidinium_carterae.1